MLQYAVRRISQGILVVCGVTSIVFLAIRLIGDPVRRMLPIGATQEQYDALASQIGFDKPLATQFVDFATGIVHLDLGQSVWLESPVVSVLAARLPNTLRLMAAGIGLAVVLSVVIGTVAALNAGRWFDRIATTLTIVLLSLPWFWTGALLILVFAVNLQWLPTSGSTGGVRSLVLPAIALALPIMGRLTQAVRQTVLEQLGQEYITAARSKGLSRAYIVRAHLPRNILLPIASFVGWETIRSLGASTVVVETVFSYAGVGHLVVEAAQRQDVILLQSTVLVVALMIVTSYFLFDLLYSWIDPRLRLRT